MRPHLCAPLKRDPSDWEPSRLQPLQGKNQSQHQSLHGWRLPCVIFPAWKCGNAGLRGSGRHLLIGFSTSIADGCCLGVSIPALKGAPVCLLAAIWSAESTERQGVESAKGLGGLGPWHRHTMTPASIHADAPRGRRPTLASARPQDANSLVPSA